MNYTPLLNCQEFPPTPNGPQYTEVELPKNSLVDVVFVASDFVDQTSSSIAILDDIEILYESDPSECPVDARRPSEQAPAPENSRSGSSAASSSSAAAASSSSAGARRPIDLQTGASDIDENCRLN